MLLAINEISSRQEKPMQYINNNMQMIMEYDHTYPGDGIRYHVSDIQLHIDLYAVYLVLPKARSRSARLLKK